MELNSGRPQRRHGTCFLLDRHSRNKPWDIEDTKCIIAEQVEFLLSEPVASLIERGRTKCPDIAPRDVSQKLSILPLPGHAAFALSSAAMIDS